MYSFIVAHQLIELRIALLVLDVTKSTLPRVESAAVAAAASSLHLLASLPVVLHNTPNSSLGVLAVEPPFRLYPPDPREATAVTAVRHCSSEINLPLSWSQLSKAEDSSFHL